MRLAYLAPYTLITAQFLAHLRLYVARESYVGNEFDVFVQLAKEGTENQTQVEINGHDIGSLNLNQVSEVKVGVQVPEGSFSVVDNSLRFKQAVSTIANAVAQNPGLPLHITINQRSATVQYGTTVVSIPLHTRHLNDNYELAYETDQAVEEYLSRVYGVRLEANNPDTEIDSFETAKTMIDMLYSYAKAKRDMYIQTAKGAGHKIPDAYQSVSELYSSARTKAGEYIEDMIELGRKEDAEKVRQYVKQKEYQAQKELEELQRITSSLPNPEDSETYRRLQEQVRKLNEIKQQQRSMLDYLLIAAGVFVIVGLFYTLVKKIRAKRKISKIKSLLGFGKESAIEDIALAIWLHSPDSSDNYVLSNAIKIVRRISKQQLAVEAATQQNSNDLLAIILGLVAIGMRVLGIGILLAVPAFLVVILGRVSVSSTTGRQLGKRTVLVATAVGALAGTLLGIQLIKHIGRMILAKVKKTKPEVSMSQLQTTLLLVNSRILAKAYDLA